MRGRIDGFFAWGERAATDLAAALGKVKPGDVEGFFRGRRDREKLREADPAHAFIVSEAEKAWVVGAAALGKVKPGDIEGFFRGRRDREKLREAIPAHASIVSEAEKAWVVGSVEGSRLRSSRCCRPTPSGRPRGPRGADGP